MPRKDKGVPVESIRNWYRTLEPVGLSVEEFNKTIGVPALKWIGEAIESDIAKTETEGEG